MPKTMREVFSNHTILHQVPFYAQADIERVKGQCQIWLLLPERMMWLLECPRNNDHNPGNLASSIRITPAVKKDTPYIAGISLLGRLGASPCSFAVAWEPSVPHAHAHAVRNCILPSV